MKTASIFLAVLALTSVGCGQLTDLNLGDSLETQARVRHRPATSDAQLERVVQERLPQALKRERGWVPQDVRVETVRFTHRPPYLSAGFRAFVEVKGRDFWYVDGHVDYDAERLTINRVEPQFQRGYSDGKRR